jgi:hypothetical protein
VQKLLLAATSQSTQASYATAVAHYSEWCARWSYDADPLAVTVAQASEWLTAAGSERNLMATSLRTYRSALSTAWATAGGTGPNPLQDSLIKRVIKGYRNIRMTLDSEMRMQRAGTISLTVELLAAIESGAPGAQAGTPDEIMVWAAACLLTFGLNRCGEIFRSTRTHRPAILASAVTFYDHPLSVLPRELNPGNWQGASLPGLYSVALGQTKADQEGTNPDQRIAAAPTVRALWRWMHIRRDLGGQPDEPLFAVPGCRTPLTRERLFTTVASWHKVVSGAAPKVSGKAFRRGGNQSLVASGASVSDMKHAGRWASNAMPALYSSAKANEQRGLHVSCGMGQLYETAAAAARRQQ